MSFVCLAFGVRHVVFRLYFVGWGLPFLSRMHLFCRWFHFALQLFLNPFWILISDWGVGLPQISKLRFETSILRVDLHVLYLNEMLPLLNKSDAFIGITKLRCVRVRVWVHVQYNNCF